MSINCTVGLRLYKCLSGEVEGDFFEHVKHRIPVYPSYPQYDVYQYPQSILDICNVCSKVYYILVIAELKICSNNRIRNKAGKVTCHQMPIKV